MDAVSGLMVLKEAPLPAKIRELGAEGINQIWRNAKLRGAGMKRAKTLLSAAEHSIGSQEAPEAAALEIESLLEDYEKYKGRMAELMGRMEEKIKEVPYVEKLLAIHGIGLKTVCGFLQKLEN